MGDYLVATPAKGGTPPAIIVLRKGTPPRALFASASNTAALFDPTKQRGLNLKGLLVEVDAESITDFNVDGDGSVVTITKEQIALVDLNRRRPLFTMRLSDPRGKSISYSAYNAGQKAWIENTDAEPDGYVDIRNTKSDDGAEKIEFRLGERWLERVVRNGQTGVLLNGQFMSVAAARKKLGVPMPLPQR